MSAPRLIPADLLLKYEWREWRNASAVLHGAHPEEWDEILKVMRGFKLLRSNIVAAGGSKTAIAGGLDAHFYRRLAAMKSLLAEHLGGEVDLPVSILNSIRRIPSLVIKSDDEKTKDDFARTLQGIRHISGIRPWGPYQQAQAVGRMIGEGVDMLGIKSVLGLSTQRANLLRRVFFSIEQMKEDPEFEEFVTPDLFSQFVEAQKQPKVREWLGWNEQAATFENADHRREFYRWLTGMEDEEGNRLAPKIIDAKDFRFLPKVMEDATIFERFVTEPSLSLQDAYRALATEVPEVHVDWRRIIRRDVDLLHNGVPAMDIHQATDDDLGLLTSLLDACQALVEQIEVLREHAG